MLNDLFEVRLPLAEVVVHVNAGNARGLCTPLQLCDVFADGERKSQQFVAFRKIEIVDDVDQEQSSFRLVRSRAMKIVTCARHWQRCQSVDKFYGNQPTKRPLHVY